MTTTCPVCESAVSNGKSCMACGSDLSILVDLDRVAAGFYNDALSLAKAEGASEQAIGKLQAAIALKPSHTASRLVLGKLLAQRGDYERARQLLGSVLESPAAAAGARAKATEGLARIDAIAVEQRAAEEARRREQIERRHKESIRRRWKLAASVAGLLIFGVASTAYIATLPVSPDRAAHAVQGALNASPAIRSYGLKASASDGAVALSGTVPDPARRELADAIARAAAGGARIDPSRLLVDNVSLTTELQRVLNSLPQVLSAHVPGIAIDLVDAAGGAKIMVLPSVADTLRLAGTVPMPELKPLIRELAASIWGGRAVDDSAVQVADPYIEYSIRPGDAPESIARRLCGTARRLDVIRGFSRDNAEVLDRMQIGATIRIPKRLLVRGAATDGRAGENR
jgi:tetratricopeptide (TPR) repeat protein